MMETVLTVRCGWCSAPMGVKDGHGVSGESHGICPDCFAKMSPPRAFPVGIGNAWQCPRCGGKVYPVGKEIETCPLCESAYRTV